MIGAIETINIYGPNGALLMNAPVTDNCERNETIMGDEYVSLSFYRENKTIIPSFSYLEYDGKFYFCKEDYYPKNAGGHYQYEVKFVSAFNMLDKFVFMRYVSVGEETWREAEFNINANILTIGTIIIQSIRESVKRLPDCKLKSHLSEIGLPSNNKYGDSKLQALSFSGMDIRSAITTVANTWETECWIEETGSNVYLHFDKCETGDILMLSDEYVENNGEWKSGGLTDCSYASNKNTLVQRIIPYGSERNIIRKVAQQNVAGSIMNVSYAKRLKLDPNTTYNVNYDGESTTITTDADGAFSLLGVNTGVESVEFFDDIYPRETFVIDSVAQKGNQNYPYYTITAHASSGVNPTLPIEIAEGLTLSIIFESGYLNGFEFEVRDDSKTDGVLTLTIIPQTDGDDVQLPIGSFIPKEGDTFAMFNMVMPESYLTAAKQELAQEAYVKLCEIRDTVPELNCQSEPSYFVENGINIKIGTRISVESELLGDQPYVSRVISYSHSLTTPDTVSFKLCSSRIIGALAAINNAIADQTNSMNGLYQNSISLSRRGWRDAKELADMLESLAAEMLLVGNEKWQFAISCNITILSSDGKFSGLQITAGMLQHTQPPYTERVNKGVWQMPASTYSTTVISDPNAPYYLYADVSGEINGTWLISTDSKDDENLLLVGTISSEFEGQRVFNRTYGYTAITGGKITTEQIQDANRNLIIDFSSNPPRILARNGAEIVGNIKFKSSSGEYKGIEEGITESIENLEIGGNNLILNSRCDKEIPVLSTTGGYLKGSYVDLLISDEVTYNGNPTLKLEQNTPLISRQTWIQFDRYKLSDNKLDVSKYVFSCMMYVPATTPNPVHQDDLIGIYIYAGVNGSMVLKKSYDLTKKGTWQKITAVFESVELLQEPDAWLAFRIACNVSVYGASIKAYIAEIQLVKGNKETAWKPAPEDAQNELKDAIAAEEEARNAALADVSKEMAGLQEQIDGKIESFFGNEDPKLTNEPAATWLKEGSEDEHLNDTFTNLITGDSWRWSINSETGTYDWTILGDYGLSEALKQAGKAQSTADGKSTTYLSKPTSYSKGDLWILESDTVHTGGKKGDVLTANATRSSYAAADWSKKVRYTDDTLAETAKNLADAAKSAADSAQAEINAMNNDAIFDVSEKQAIRTEWECISGNANTTTTTGGANGSYKKACLMAESYSLEHGELDTQFSSLRTYLSSVQLYTDSNYGDDAGENQFSRTTLATNFANYYNAETELIAYVQKKIVDDVQIGGTNLAVCSTCVLQNMVREGYSFKQISADTKDVFNLQIGFINDNTFYASSIDKTITSIGKYSFEIKASKIFNKIRIKANGSIKDTGVIFIGFTYEEGTTYIVSFEITNITQGSFSWKNVKIEEGNKPTAWSPAPEDVEAKISELDYLKKAMEGSTEIDGGLLLTNVIELKDENGKINGGVSGFTDDNVAFWSGGTYEEALNQAAGNSETLPVLITKDENGYGTKFGVFKIVEDGIEVSSSGGDSKVLVTSQSIDEVSVIQKPIELFELGKGYEAIQEDVIGAKYFNVETTTNKAGQSVSIIYSARLGSIGGRYKTNSAYNSSNKATAEISVSVSTMDMSGTSPNLKNNASVALGNIYLIIKKNNVVIHESLLLSHDKTYSCMGNNGIDGADLEINIPSSLDFGKGYGDVVMYICSNTLSGYANVTTNRPSGIGQGHSAGAGMSIKTDISFIGIDKYIVMARDGIAIIQRQDAYFLVKNPTSSSLLDIRMKGLPTSRALAGNEKGRLYSNNGILMVVT